jgi:hypothetical protein
VSLTPTVDDVAAIIRARTKDRNGNEIGTFSEDTRPTAAQAQEAIDHAVILVHQKVGPIGDGQCGDLARIAAAIGAAAEIELSYYPEQSRTDRSPYSYLMERYTEALDGVVLCVTGDLPGIDPGTGQTTGLGRGTLVATSGVVNDFYTGQLWPRTEVVPHPQPLKADG